MTEIDVFGNVIEKKCPLKEVVEPKKRDIIEEVVTSDSPIIIDKIPTVEDQVIEEQPKKRGRKKKLEE